MTDKNHSVNGRLYVQYMDSENILTKHLTNFGLIIHFIFFVQKLLDRTLQTFDKKELNICPWYMKNIIMLKYKIMSSVWINALLVDAPSHAKVPCWSKPIITYFHRPWDLVHILRLDDGFEIIFQDFGEIILKLGATEVGQDFLPVWGILGKKKSRYLF